ncbi:hypothetical protein [Agaribacterium sp. ZY112]|uniref:hypothetical protein n=1 Tax=Agaribacterium sp. ZY112 TaxID=3233574 RepID=UPI003524A365
MQSSAETKISYSSHLDKLVEGISTAMPEKSTDGTLALDSALASSAILAHCSSSVDPSDRILNAARALADPVHLSPSSPPTL